MGEGPRYLQGYIKAFPASVVGAKAILQTPCCFLGDFYLIFNTRKDHYASKTFWKLKESETIKRFAAVRASSREKCHPSPRINAEGLKKQVASPWDLLEIHWVPGLAEDLASRRMPWTNSTPGPSFIRPWEFRGS